MKKKTVTLVKMLALSLVLISLVKMVYDKVSDGKNITKYDFAMGTSVSVVLNGCRDANALADNIISDVKALDEKLLSWRSACSETAKLNENYTEGVSYTISQELYSVLCQSYDICEKTDGALDITIRPLANLWNIENADDDFKLPSQAEIEKTLKSVDYRKIDLTANNEITISEAGMLIDLGATGKGYALDKAREEIVSKGAKGAIISVGGSVLVYGSKDDGSSWRVGIRNPKGEIDEMIGYIQLPAGSDICVSTSGDYEKYVTVDGKRYHHILDSKTGSPSLSGLASVTIVCESGLLSDGLSTACFVLGKERSLPILREYNAEAVFIDKDNNITVTDGLKECFTEE